MPSLGADMDEGTVVEWKVAPGDVVHRGDVVAVIDTEKADVDAEVYEDGTIERLLVPTGRTVPVGTPLALIAPAGAPATPPPPAVPPAGAPEAVASAEAAAPGDGPSRGRRDARSSSPRARRLAEERGVDLEEVRGTGPGGAVVAADIPAVAVAPGPGPGPGPAERPAPAAAPLRTAEDGTAAMRRAVGRSMARSKREIPHYYLRTTVDLGPALAWLRQRNGEVPPAERVLPAALLLRATALAARGHPDVNGTFEDDTFTPSAAVHLGVAVAVRGGGLVAPAIHDADRLRLPDLMAALADLVARVRSGGLRSAELADPTLTVTNLGDQGVEEVYGVITPPQVALVGFGRVVERPWAVDGLLGVRPVVTVTLSADHRVSDGHRGARFLTTIERLLREPEEL